MYNAIEAVNKLRIILHENVYNDPDTINKLLEYLNNSSPMYKDFIANYTYDNNTRVISMKVKKSNLKRYSDYSHNSNFYYPIVYNAMINFLSDSDIKAKIYSFLHNDPSLKEIYDAIVVDKTVSITLICNITSILENMVFIYL